MQAAIVRNVIASRKKVTKSMTDGSTESVTDIVPDSESDSATVSLQGTVCQTDIPIPSKDIPREKHSFLVQSTSRTEHP